MFYPGKRCLFLYPLLLPLVSWIPLTSKWNKIYIEVKIEIGTDINLGDLS